MLAIFSHVVVGRHTTRDRGMEPGTSLLTKRHSSTPSMSASRKDPLMLLPVTLPNQSCTSCTCSRHAHSCTPNAATARK